MLAPRYAVSEHHTASDSLSKCVHISKSSDQRGSGFHGLGIHPLLINRHGILYERLSCSEKADCGHLSLLLTLTGLVITKWHKRRERPTTPSPTSPKETASHILKPSCMSAVTMILPTSIIVQTMTEQMKPKVEMLTSLRRSTGYLSTTSGHYSPLVWHSWVESEVSNQYAISLSLYELIFPPGYGLIAPVLGEINADIGPSPNIYWVPLVNLCGGAVFFLMVGQLSDIFGRRW